jgi:hypothetical protein
MLLAGDPDVCGYDVYLTRTPSGATIGLGAGGGGSSSSNTSSSKPGGSSTSVDTSK